MGHLEVAVGGVVVADQPQAVGPDRQRGVLSHLAGPVQR